MVQYHNRVPVPFTTDSVRKEVTQMVRYIIVRRGSGTTPGHMFLCNMSPDWLITTKFGDTIL